MEKTKSMVITPSGKIPSNFKVTFNNKLVEHVKKYKYLGFVIHNNGNFMRGTLALKQKALNAWFKCRSILYSQQINNVNLLLQLFDKLVKPVLLYGVEVWGPDYLHKLQVKDNLNTIDGCFCEMIHNKACKSILGVRPNCSNLAARAELGRTPLYPFIAGAAFRYWHKLITQSKNSILKQAYESETEINNMGKLSWVTSVKNINDLSQWNIKDKRISKGLFKDIILDLQNHYKRTTLKYLASLKLDGDGEKLRTYSLIKNNHEMEPYLKNNLHKVYRSKIASLRVGSHDLEIERGRHVTPVIPPQDRRCKFCPEKVEDESHFMAECLRFNKNRLTLVSNLKLEDILRGKDKVLIFSYLLTTEILNENSCLEVGKFIHDCFKLRTLAGNSNPLD
jgi:hypothetical protein